MKNFSIRASVEEAKELARKELESLGLEVDLDSLKYEIVFGKSSRIYDENMPMTSSVFSLFEETPADQAQKCYINITNEDGYTAQAIISDKNVDRASKIIANAILMTYSDAVE